VTIKGQITAPNSTTQISGVEYQVDTDKESNTWTACSADDGTFNSLTENFTCSATTPENSLEHKVFVRAYDANGSRTAKGHYLTYSDGASTPSSPSYIFSAAKSVTTISQNSVTAMINYGALKNDSYLSVGETPKVGSFRLPNTSYWQVGPKTETWFKNSFNKSNILSSEIQKPITLIFKYDSSGLEKSISEKTLKLAYSVDGKKWKIVQSILDTKKKELYIVTKNGGYYMIVGGTSGASSPKVQGAKTQKVDNQVNIQTPTSEVKQPENLNNVPASKKHCFLFYCW
jgi:hypothetical protein